MKWSGGASAASIVPSARSLLRWLYVGRVCVAAAIYLAAFLKFSVAAPLDVLVTSLLLVTTVVVTIASYWHTHVRGRPPGRTFLYGQALYDIALITAVVHMTGGPQSDLTGLYVPLIAVTAVLMPPASTALIAALVAFVYLADVFFGHPTAMTGQIFLQLSVFAAVAAATAYFASRVSVMGAEREVLAGELRQVRLEAADVLRNIPTGIVTVGGDGRLLYCNPAAEQILGFRERQWRGRSIMPEFAKVAPEFWAAVTATARRGVRAMRVEATVRRADRTFPIGVTTTTLEVEPGGVPRVTAIFTDISDSKRLEELHLRAERLEAVAELSSSLAHEIKNPLASIRSSVEQLGRAKRVDADDKFLTGLIVRESDRLSRLLSEFLDFSRVRVTECRPLDLCQVAAAAIRLVREHPDCADDAVIDLTGGPTPMPGFRPGRPCDGAHRAAARAGAARRGGDREPGLARRERQRPGHPGPPAGPVVRAVRDGPHRGYRPRAGDRPARRRGAPGARARGLGPGAGDDLYRVFPRGPKERRGCVNECRTAARAAISRRLHE